MTKQRRSLATKRRMVPEKYKRGIEMLEDFGLTENDALIYSYLLERGTEVGGSKIAFGTGLHRQYVYLSIPRLMELGLIESTHHGKRNRYKAIAPNQLEKIAKRKVFQVEDIVRELNTFSTVGHEQVFEIYQGNKQLQEFEIGFAHEIVENSEQFVIGGASDLFYFAMEDRYEEFASIVSKKKLKTYYLGPAEEFLTVKRAQEVYVGFTWRTMKNFPKGILNTVIREKSVVFYSFANPPLVYVIKSKVTADSYKLFFDMLWKMADENS